MSNMISFPEIVWNITKSKEIKQVIPQPQPIFKNAETKG